VSHPASEVAVGPRRPARAYRALPAFWLAGALACSGTIGTPPTGEPPPRSGDGGRPASTGGGGGGAGGGGGPKVSDPPAGCGYAPRRVWKLTPEQYSRSVEALLPEIHRAGDGIANSLTVNSEAFSNESAAMALTGPHVGQVLESSFTLARAAAADPAKLLPCLGTAAPPRACLQELVNSYGAKAFRRDLAADETSRLVDFVASQAAGGDVRGAVKQFFLYLFSSPHFLFRTELGAEGAQAQGGGVALTGFEKASALSYFLTDGPPDATLSAAARSGGLDTRAEFEAQARRLVSKAESAPGLTRLLRESFRTDVVTGVQKDATAFPAWTPALAADLALEAESFIRQVLWQEGGKLSTLLTADFSMLNGSLATFYGVPDTNPAFHKVTYRAGQRAGLLTQAGVMAVQAISEESTPVRRGLYVRELLLCQPVPDPPPTLNVVLPKPDGMNQWRERLAIHSKDPSCAACHAQMDAVGLAFENYDGIGRYRDKDLGRPIDTSGVLTGLAAGDAPFKNAVELAPLLARAPEVKTCFVTRALRYAAGRSLDEPGLDRCALDRLDKQFATSQGNLLDLAVAIATDETFTTRR
jgi:hypothetical protein